MARLCWAVVLICWTATLVSVERVIDGDTIVVELAIWPKVVITETVRLLGVDAPERTTIEPWRAARLYTMAWLERAGATTVTACKYDSFGRALGKVVSTTQGDLSASLILAGHGTAYTGRR